MSVHEVEARVPPIAQPPSLSSIATTPTNTSIDIGVFVDRYNRLQELIYPLRLFGSAVFYVIR